MCGIVGIFLAPHVTDPRRLAAIEAMATTLHHRGPDGSGTWVDSNAGIALGHRRLAIVDLSEAGHQPMLSHGKELVMTFNGEVYNFAELRQELEAKGHRFRGHSDTEVMLAAFESLGIESALRRFAGMFAFGLWDREQRVLHLVRDRLGKKPLYVALDRGALLFASELKAIRAFPGFEPRVDPAAIAMVLRRGWVPDQQCIYEGVFKLPPGTMLSVSADDLQSGGSETLRRQIRCWWSIAEVAEAGQQDLLDLSVPELESELDRLLRLMVRERMVADVPLGAFLSGGIDSSTVVALMQAQSMRPVRTFTIGFREASYDEAAHAARVAQHLGTDHTECRLTPAEALATIPKLPEVWDEPFADESQIPTLLISQVTRQHVTVALSGDGGDECFAGYPRHFLRGSLAAMFGLPQAPRRIVASALQMLSPAMWQELLRVLPLSTTFRQTLSVANPHRCARLLTAADESAFYDQLITFDPVPVTPAPANVTAPGVPALPDPISRLIYRDMVGYLPGDILVKLDRASMAASLEARCPFLDHRMVEFAWRLPTAVKVRDGQGKWLLRRILARYLPKELFERPKQGFNVPIGTWLTGSLRDWAHELLAVTRIRRDGFLDPQYVEACWQQHQSGRSDRAGELWAILMVQAWLDATRKPIPPLPSSAKTGTAAVAEAHSSQRSPDHAVQSLLHSQRADSCWS
jgi:asparagine synthase (glutamine-hydrolysing)